MLFSVVQIFVCLNIWFVFLFCSPVQIRGNVTRVGSVRPLVVGITFECRKCGARIPQTFPDGRFALPSVRHPFRTDYFVDIICRQIIMLRFFVDRLSC
jgi:hypothetical protein